jgi:hypothetical protein
MFGQTLGIPVTVEKNGGWTKKVYKQGKMTITLRHNTPSREAVERAGRVLNEILLAHIDSEAQKATA